MNNSQLKKLSLSDIDRTKKEKNYSMFDLGDSTNPAVQELFQLVHQEAIKKDKRLSGWRIPNLDLSSIPTEDFDDVQINRVEGLVGSLYPEWDIIEFAANLSHTGVKINPSKLHEKSIEGADLSGNDFSHLNAGNWEDVSIRGANLSNVTGLNFDILKLAKPSPNDPEHHGESKPDLRFVNFNGTDLSWITKADWDKVAKNGADFTGTGARITVWEELKHKFSKQPQSKTVEQPKNNQAENNLRNSNFGLAMNSSQMGRETMRKPHPDSRASSKENIQEPER